MADRESLSKATNLAIKRAVKKAAKKRPTTQLRPLYPKWKVAQNPTLSRSPYSGVNKEEAKWRRHLKHVDKTSKVDGMKADYIQGKMDSRFKEAMLLKKRRQLLREATESLKARDDHVIALLNEQNREVTRQMRQDCARNYRKRMEELKDEEALTCRHELLESRRQRRISEGLSPDLDPADINIRQPNTKLSVRRRAIEKILLEHNPRLASPKKFDSLLKKWKGRELDLLKNIREKYGVPAPKKTPTKKPQARQVPSHPPFGSAEGRQKSAFVLQQRQMKREKLLASRRKVPLNVETPSPPMTRRRSRKAATPTRAELVTRKASTTKKSGGNIRRITSTPVVAKRVSSTKTVSTPTTSRVGAQSKTKVARDSPKQKETQALNVRPQKLETDFSEFAVLEKKKPLSDVPPSSPSNDIAASIRARILQRQRTLQETQIAAAAELSTPTTPEIELEEVSEEPEESEVEDTPMPPKPAMSQKDIIKARRMSIERREQLELDTNEPSEEDNDGSELKTTPETDEDEHEEHEEHDDDDFEHHINTTETESADKLAAAMAAVNAALADDDEDEEDEEYAEAMDEDGDVNSQDQAECKDDKAPQPCSAAQNDMVVGTWTFKEVDEAFKTMRVLKDYTFTYREDRLPSETEKSDQTWMRRKGHWGSSVTGEAIQLVFTFTEVVNGHIVNGRHTEDGPAEAMKEDWIVTLNELQMRWEKKKIESSDAIAERLEKMRVDLERAKASSSSEEDLNSLAPDGEVQPPAVPGVEPEEQEEEAEADEGLGEDEEEEGEHEDGDDGEEYEEGDEGVDDEEGEDGGEDGELDGDDEDVTYDEEEEEEEEDDSGNYEDEDMPLEDRLVGTWQRQDGMKDREYESIQIFADGTCSHRRDRDFKTSREWFTSKGTWTLDEENDRLDVVFTKCSKGVQETEGSNVTETEDQVESRAWSIEVEGDLLVNWEKEEEF